MSVTTHHHLLHEHLPLHWAESPPLLYDHILDKGTSLGGDLYKVSLKKRMYFQSLAHSWSEFSHLSGQLSVVNFTLCLCISDGRNSFRLWKFTCSKMERGALPSRSVPGIHILRGDQQSHLIGEVSNDLARKWIERDLAVCAKYMLWM